MSSYETAQKALESHLPEGVTLHPFAMEDLKVSETIRLKCQIPLCKNYGMRKVCPPHMPPIPTIREALKGYQKGYIVAMHVDLHTLNEDEEKKVKEMEKLQTKMVDIITDLEHVLIGVGFYKVYGLGPGSCWLCETCTPAGVPCRHPYKARPGPSAMGIDITELAQKAGVHMEWPPKNEVLVMGMLIL